VVKFCYKCNQFQQWAVFGEKGRLKTCGRCRVVSSRTRKIKLQQFPIVR
jgi:hypothetical protein